MAAPQTKSFGKVNVGISTFLLHRDAASIQENCLLRKQKTAEIKINLISAVVMSTLLLGWFLDLELHHVMVADRSGVKIVLSIEGDAVISA